jgi:hypothetical protein
MKEVFFLIMVRQQKMFILTQIKSVQMIGVVFRVARFFLVHATKTGKMYQMRTKCTQCSKNIPNLHKIFQMAIKYINIFLSKALQNVPKLGFLV